MERKDFKKYFKKRVMELKDSKPFVASLTLISAVLVIAAGTYAFTSYTEWVKNHFQSNGSALDVRIVEEFEEKTLSPNIQVTKDVKVRNTSSHKGLIRVKLDESFVSFEIARDDQTEDPTTELLGSANLATTTTVGTSIDRGDTGTWKVGNTYDSGLTDKTNNKLYYTATDPSDTVTLSEVTNQPVKFKTGKAVDRSAFLSDLIAITFDSNVLSDADPVPSTGEFWMYDATTGYFYYSKALSGDEMTETSLINKLTAASEISNEYKGALYKLNVTTEGVYANEGGLSSWNIQAGPVYNMLLTQLEN